MKVNCLIKRLSGFVAALILVIGLVHGRPFDALADAAGGKVIKVFFPLQTGFAQIDENGVYSGYTYEYLMRVAQLTGWQYDFVAVNTTNDNLTQGLDQVSNGTLQITGAMNYTPELGEKYEYSVAYGESSYAIIAREENIALNMRTLFDYKNLRIALVETAKGQNTLLEDFCKGKRIDYQPVYAKSNAECRQLIEDGHADVMVSKDVTNTPGYKMIAKFSSTPFYFAVSKGETELVRELNRALTLIDVADSDFRARLHKKYFSVPSDTTMPLTAEERAYLESEPTIRVAVSGNRAPIQDYDEKTGAFSGIIIDILGEMSERSGLRFEYIAVESEEALRQMLSEGKCDVVAGVSYLYDHHRPQNDVDGILRTFPLFSSPVIRIQNNRGESKHPEALVARSIKEFETTKPIQYAGDILEIFDLVNRGEYGEAYVNGYQAQYVVEEKEYKNVSLTFTPFGNYELCLGVSSECDLRLISILNQAIAALPESEIEDIVYSNMSRVQKSDIWSVIRRDPTQITIPAVVVLVVILSLLLLLFFKTRRLNKLISQEKNEYKAIAQMDRLSNAYNNAAFKQLAESYLTQEGSAPFGALLVCDVDDFKFVNDTYGHMKGDEVISGIGGLLNTIFREEDLVGRLGGDEFAVMMKNVDSVEALKERCELMREKTHSLIEECPITLSVGAVVFQGKSDFERLFREADLALYEVKRKGKNDYLIVEDVPRRG